MRHCFYIYATIFIGILLASTCCSEEQWHHHSLTLFTGYQDNPATISSRGTYQKIHLGPGHENGMAFTMAMNPDLYLDLALSRSQVSGTQRNAPGSGNESNALRIHLRQNRLSATAKKRYNHYKSPFVPWVHGGLSAILLETREQEHVATPGGVLPRPERKRDTALLGIEMGGGIDIYPTKDSALALSMELRYSHMLLEGTFDGDLNGFAVLFGLKWDFWPITD